MAKQLAILGRIWQASAATQLPEARGDIREIVGQPVFVPLYKLFQVSRFFRIRAAVYEIRWAPEMVLDAKAGWKYTVSTMVWTDREYWLCAGPASAGSDEISWQQTLCVCQIVSKCCQRAKQEQARMGFEVHRLSAGVDTSGCAHSAAKTGHPVLLADPSGQGSSGCCRRSADSLNPTPADVYQLPLAGTRSVWAMAETIPSNMSCTCLPSYRHPSNLKPTCLHPPGVLIQGAQFIKATGTATADLALNLCDAAAAAISHRRCTARSSSSRLVPRPSLSSQTPSTHVRSC